MLKNCVRYATPVCNVGTWNYASHCRVKEKKYTEYVCGYKCTNVK